jgi:hypothetical protein
VTEKTPLTSEVLAGMDMGQVADLLSTRDGRREITRVLGGKRAITPDLLRSPEKMTTEEVADHWAEIVATAGEMRREADAKAKEGQS